VFRLVANKAKKNIFFRFKARTKIPTFSLVFALSEYERRTLVKSQATTVYFRLGKLRRVNTYVQQMWGIIGHVTVEAGNTEGTDGAPPHSQQNMKKNCISKFLFFFSGVVDTADERTFICKYLREFSNKI
jgi:hypothetical protein